MMDRSAHKNDTLGDILVYKFAVAGPWAYCGHVRQEV